MASVLIDSANDHVSVLQGRVIIEKITQIIDSDDTKVYQFALHSKGVSVFALWEGGPNNRDDIQGAVTIFFRPLKNFQDTDLSSSKDTVVVIRGFPNNKKFKWTVHLDINSDVMTMSAHRQPLHGNGLNALPCP